MITGEKVNGRLRTLYDAYVSRQLDRLVMEIDKEHIGSQLRSCFGHAKEPACRVRMIEDRAISCQVCGRKYGIFEWSNLKKSAHDHIDGRRVPARGLERQEPRVHGAASDGTQYVPGQKRSRSEQTSNED